MASNLVEFSYSDITNEKDRRFFTLSDNLIEMLEKKNYTNQGVVFNIQVFKDVISYLKKNYKTIGRENPELENKSYHYYPLPSLNTSGLQFFSNCGSREEKDISNEILRLLQTGKNYTKEFMKKSILEMRENFKTEDYFINKLKHHVISRPKEEGYSIVDDIVSQRLNFICYNYRSETNLDRYHSFLRNNFSVVDAFIKYSEKLYFVKNGYYVNNTIERNQNPLFDYENSGYFFKQQKESIAAMELLEAENVFLLGNDKDSIPGTMNNESINKVAIKVNFGVLSNNPGTGKTRVAAAVALRNAIKSRDVHFRYEPALSLYVENLDFEHKKLDEFTRVNSYGGISTAQEWINREKQKFVSLADIEFEKEDATLVVVSLSTFPQWKDEFENMIKEFKLEDKVVFYCMKEKARKVDVVIPRGCDIILTTSNFYNNHISKIDYPIMFNRIIFDEPDTIRYSLGNEKTQARFKWLVSATVNNTINTFILNSERRANQYSRISEIESSGIRISGYDEERCNILKKFIIFVPKDSVDNSSKLNFIEYKNFKDTVFLNRFKENIARIDAGLAEAFSAGDENEINRILGVTEERMCKMDRIYNKHLNTLEKLESLVHKQVDNEKKVLEELDSLDKKLEEMLEHKASECPICLDELDLNDAVLFDCCFVMTHKGCTGLLLKERVQDRCIVCRASPTDIYNFKDTICYERQNISKKTGETKSIQKKEVACGEGDKKLSVRNDVFAHIFNKENSKTLIYATCNENDGVVTFIESLGYKKGVDFNVLKGRVNQRARIISEYKTRLVPVLILLQHENAAGLNLTETTDLIVYNRTSSQILKQVVGRVDRLGLDHDVNIHLLDKFDYTLGDIRDKYENCRIRTIDIEENVTFKDTGL